MSSRRYPKPDRSDQALAITASATLMKPAMFAPIT